MRIRMSSTLAACLALSACRDVPAPPATRPTTLASHPHAMDRLARLMREQFASSEPVRVEALIRCETTRVRAAIGDDFTVRQRLLTDSLRQEYSSEQFDQLGRRLAAAPAPSAGDPLCRQVSREAEQEAPVRAGT